MPGKSRWPYPRVFAHRGGGTLAPENTLAAVRTGLAHGYRAVEFDVMLSADEIPVLMHDPVFGRTVKVSGSVAQTSAADLDALDAGTWFGSAFAGEPVPRFEAVVRFCQTNGVFMNIEIKPSPGFEARTGEVVAALTESLYQGAPAVWGRPLFSSFSSTALAAAKRCAPTIVRGHLFDQVPTNWRELLNELECVSLHCNHKKLSEELARDIVDSQRGLFCYTVNDPERAKALFSWGVDAFCTDRIDLIDPAMLPK